MIGDDFPSPRLGVWQPIETAPKWGVVLLLDDERHVFSGYWGEFDNAGGVYEAWTHKSFPCFGVTHWMPLPEPPISQEGK